MKGLLFKINNEKKHLTDLGWELIEIIERSLSICENISSSNGQLKTVYDYYLICLGDNKDICTISENVFLMELCEQIYIYSGKSI